MKITKFQHACVLIEEAGQTVIFDPGVYSYEPGIVDMSKPPQIDFIAITHEHADHCHIPFITELCNYSPNLKIITNQSVATVLEGKIKAEIITEPNAEFKFFESPHENIPTGNAPSNLGIHFKGLFTHPGDSHSFNETMPVLAMPMTAPWGSMTAATDKILALKPRVVIPIHDWHWRPEALNAMYIRLKELLAGQNIDFKIPVDGEPFEV